MSFFLRLGGHAYEPAWDSLVEIPELYLVKDDIQERYSFNISVKWIDIGETVIKMPVIVIVNIY